MAVCQVCSKKRTVGNNVSHANNRTKRRILPNLQRVHVMDCGTSKRMMVCTRCLRSGNVTKAV